MGRLTTHVLDVAHGRPAGGMTVELVAIEGNTRRPIIRVTTNHQGRCDEPLLEGNEFGVGVWELRFHVAAYFSAADVLQSSPPFLDVVSVQFGIANADQNYHVPLLVTPWSYSTYRGS